MAVNTGSEGRVLSLKQHIHTLIDTLILNLSSSLWDCLYYTHTHTYTLLLVLLSSFRRVSYGFTPSQGLKSSSWDTAVQDTRYM